MFEALLAGLATFWGVLAGWFVVTTKGPKNVTEFSNWLKSKDHHWPDPDGR